MSSDDATKLTCPPLPKRITDCEIQRVFQDHGYRLSSKKEIPIDLLGVLQPLLIMLQWCQWWGDLFSLNDLKLSIKLSDDVFGIPVHAASGGQKIGIVPVNTVEATLNMVNRWIANLREYGANPELRAERLDDTDVTLLSNENLDTYAPLLLHLMSLTLPASGNSASSK